MTAETRSGYHHGDLRAALLANASEMLESGESFSMRALAKRAGVSAAAPYRHFDDREALESALAVEGFDGLRATMEALPAPPQAASESTRAITRTMESSFFIFIILTSLNFISGYPERNPDISNVRIIHVLLQFCKTKNANVFPKPQSDPVNQEKLWIFSTRKIQKSGLLSG